MSKLIHYTNLQSLYKIITNRTLHLTKFNYLNDRTELIAGLELICDIARNEILPNADLVVGDRKTVLEQVIDELEIQHFNAPLPDTFAFLVSFSGAPDLLSQWRAYGNYAIEFDNEHFDGNGSDFNMKSCLYEDEKKKDRARKILKSKVSQIRKESRNLESDVEELRKDILMEALAFKHESFKEESETRYIQLREKKNVFYKPKNNILIPYLEFPFSLAAIRKIHIGPIVNKELARTSMESFLKRAIENDGRAKRESHRILVETTLTPYRDVDQ